MTLKDPTNATLPLQHAALEDSNEIRQAHASANVRKVNAAVNSIMIWYVQLVLDVRATGVTTLGYGSFHSQTNHIFDLAVTLDNTFTTMDFDPRTLCAPGFQHGALSNPYYYNGPSVIGHTSP